MSDSNDFYTNLKAQLEETSIFPLDYMYKFIVPTEEGQAEEVEDLFHNSGATITKKKSKTGKYISVSVVLKIENAARVILYYKKAGKIKGIVSL